MRPALAGQFQYSVTTDGYANISGEILAVWPVHHVCRRGTAGYDPKQDPGLCSADQKIIELFRFVNYRSPSDDVTVEIPVLPPSDDSSPKEHDASDLSEFFK